MQTTFVNELGNTITASVRAESDSVTIGLIGPHSECTNTITYREAWRVLGLLVLVLLRHLVRTPTSHPATPTPSEPDSRVQTPPEFLITGQSNDPATDLISPR